MRLLFWLRHLFGRPRPIDDLEPVEDWTDPEVPFPDGSVFPLPEALDLHGLPPKIVADLVREYLLEAHKAGYRRVRIVHGKGIGVQREIVRSILAKTDFVEGFDDAQAHEGGWGATIAVLRPGAN